MSAGLRRVGLRLASVLAAGLVSAAAPARADAPLDLRWIAPTGCPTAEDVRAEFVRLVRAPAPSAAAAPALSADARIEARGTRFVLRLHTVRDGREGEREIEAESCASLARAAALVLVLAYGQGQEPADAPAPDVDDHRAPPRPRVVPPRAPVEAVPEVPPPPPPPPELPPAAPPVVIRVAPPPAPAAERVSWSVAAEAGAGGGPIPGPGLRFGAGLDRTVGRFAVSLRLAGWAPSDGTTSATGVSVRYEGLGASLGACAIPVRASRIALLACASGGLAALRGASVGAVSNRSATAPWYALAPALRARVRLVGRVHLDARVEAQVSLNRPRFAVENLGDVSQVPLVVPAGIIGLSFDI